LFSVLNGFWLANFGAFNGDVCRDLAAQLLVLAEKQGATFPLALGHRLVGTSLLHTGDLTQGRAHLDRAIALYDPAMHRPFATRFGQDNRTASLSRRSMALWPLGYPDAAVTDTEQALREAREIGHAASLFFALFAASWTRIMCGNYAAANRFADELAALADQKGASMWKAAGMNFRGWVFGLTGKASDAVRTIASAVELVRATGTTAHLAVIFAELGKVHAELGQFEDAWRWVGAALAEVETTKEKLWEAEVNRIAGEIALKSPGPDATKAQAYFECALAVARQQQAKSWELRAAMSMARLWREQGKRDEARDLLAPVYGWFTEGFDTLDLKEAKTLLDELAS
jgi:predicted ATPase